MQVTAYFNVQVMLKSRETDMPMFRPVTCVPKEFDIEIDEELRDYVEKYLKAKEEGSNESPAYGANPFFVQGLRKQLQKVFGKETKVDRMGDDDIVDSAITHAVEDKLEELVPSNSKGAIALGITPETECPEGFYMAHAYVKLKKWEVGHAEPR